MIRSVEISNFRGIQNGKLEDFTPLTIFVGPNGSGKSALLDALLIGASRNPGDAIGYSIQRHLGVSYGARWILWKGRRDIIAEVTVQTNQGNKRHTSISYKEGASETFAALVCSIDEHHQNGTYESTLIEIEFESENLYEYNKNWSHSLPDISDTWLIETPHGRVQKPLHRLYSKTIEQGRRQEVTEILSYVAPNLDSITLVTEGDKPLISLEYRDGAVPAALSGDGVHALLRLCMELASRPDGTVLIEEPEIHMHPRAVLQTAKTLWAATRRNIQVIMSTHSLELIDALLSVPDTDAEIENLSVYSLRLDDGCLKQYRSAGSDVAFERLRIGDDLR